MYISKTYSVREQIQIYNSLTTDLAEARKNGKTRNAYATYLEKSFDAFCLGRKATDRLTGNRINIPDKSERFLREFLNKSRDEALKDTPGDESWQYLDALRSLIVKINEDILPAAILEYFEFKPTQNELEEAENGTVDWFKSYTLLSIDSTSNIPSGVIEFHPGLHDGTIQAVLRIRDVIDNMPIEPGANYSATSNSHDRWDAVGCAINPSEKLFEKNNVDTDGLGLVMRNYETGMPGALLITARKRNNTCDLIATFHFPFSELEFQLREVKDGVHS